MRWRTALPLAALLVTVAGTRRVKAGTAAPGAAARRQPSVEVRGPVGDTLQSVTPLFRVVTHEFTETGCAIQVTFQVASTPDFAEPLYEATACGDSADFVPSRPLPDRATLYWRARATSASADVASPVTGPRTGARWLTLVYPNLPTGTTVETRRPTFVWRSAQVAFPPGPWSYTLTITNVATQQTLTLGTGRDTTFTPTFELESNTSYRWAVTARLTTGDSARVASAATFVIVDRNTPLITLLYQNWPNPFPSPVADRTCVWFDLARPSLVHLDVYDLRGAHVRRLVPELSSPIGAGRYGRATPGSDSGCDPRFSWDGTDTAGRTVAPGVYLLRFRGDGVDATRKMLFRGR